MSERTPRRGSIAIIVGLSIVVLMMSMALALDIGLARVHGAQLHAVTDAAALAGAAVLPGEPGAQTAAIAVGGANLVAKQAVGISAADVEAGDWDAATELFTPNPTGDAVRVTMSWSTATSFAAIAGFTTMNFQKVSIALSPRVQITCGVGGDVTTSYGGNGGADSYCSTDGAYGGGNMFAEAGICSNGDVNVGGSALIEGDAAAGAGHGTNITGSGEVTGTVRPLLAPLTMPADDWDAIRAGTNDNSAATITAVPALLSVPIPGAAMEIFPSGGAGALSRVVTITGNGDPDNPARVWLTATQLGGTQQLTIVDGPVEIYVDGDFGITAQAVVNSGLDPSMVTFFVSGDADMAGQGAFYGLIVGTEPTSDITLRGTSDYFGGYAASGEIDVSGSGMIHVDTCLPALLTVDAYIAPVLVR